MTLKKVFEKRINDERLVSDLERLAKLFKRKDWFDLKDNPKVYWSKGAQKEHIKENIVLCKRAAKRLKGLIEKENKKAKA